MKPYQSSFVYIVASRSRNLYTGVTSDLEHRVLEHKNGLVRGFTKRYRIHKLVYFEHFGDIREAIAREKQVRAWTRAKRVALIEATNPTWADLFESTGRTREKQIPRSKERPSG